MIAFVSLRQFHPKTYLDLSMGISHDWINLLESNGITPILVPNSLRSLHLLLKTVTPDLILLTNGDTVGCSSQRVEASYKERDEVEFSLLELATKNKTPTLGVCRGMQFINVYFGGTISYSQAKDHVNKDHLIDILDQRLQSVFATNSLKVNSFHNDAVYKKDLSPSLTACAAATDGVIEVISHPSLPILGVQWHPERDQGKTGAKVISLWKDLGNYV